MFASFSNTVTLYDCSLMGTDCSSCLSANIGTGFDCLWCDKLDTADTCTVLDYCKTHSTLFNNIINCPLPTITYACKNTTTIQLSIS